VLLPRLHVADQDRRDVVVREADPSAVDFDARHVIALVAEATDPHAACQVSPRAEDVVLDLLPGTSDRGVVSGYL
jgi:hypothetical protein